MLSSFFSHKRAAAPLKAKSTTPIVTKEVILLVSEKEDKGDREIEHQVGRMLGIYNKTEDGRYEYLECFSSDVADNKQFFIDHFHRNTSPRAHPDIYQELILHPAQTLLFCIDQPGKITKLRERFKDCKKHCIALISDNTEIMAEAERCGWHSIQLSSLGNSTDLLEHIIFCQNTKKNPKVINTPEEAKQLLLVEKLKLDYAQLERSFEKDEIPPLHLNPVDLTLSRIRLYRAATTREDKKHHGSVASQLISGLAGEPNPELMSEKELAEKIDALDRLTTDIELTRVSKVGL
ncbi:MAG: hypothetical protein ACYCQI_00300 [Gammaproteobacteria bacterium]